MTKYFNSGPGLNRSVVAGVTTLLENVATTLGPRGRNVILQPEGSTPIITKDGVTVATFLELEDPFENAAVQVIKQAAAQTNSEAGDGTTTATVLACSMVRQAQVYLSAGASPIELKRGVDKTVSVICENLAELARPIRSKEDIEHVATISANNDRTLGSLIATAVDSAGKDGSVTVEEARSVETSLDLLEGFRVDSGYLAGAFVTDSRRNLVRYENPIIMITDYKLERIDELLPVLEVADRSGRPLIVVADEIEGQALAALIMNAVRRKEMNSGIRVAAIKAPRYGEDRANILGDMALATGATFITQSSDTSPAEITMDMLGTAQTIEITKSNTIIVGGAGNALAVDERITSLKAELSQTEDLYSCGVVQERITRLASGVAIIRVGAATEIEMTEKRHRIEDALEAVRSAQMEGVVPGGGVALIRSVQNIEVETDNAEQAYGVELVKKAVLAPLRRMASNAGLSPDLVQADVLGASGLQGVDFTTGNVVDMMDAGILDPAKVTRCALQNAASVATTLFTTSHAIIQKN